MEKNLDNLSGPELAAYYNELVKKTGKGKQVKKFRDRKTALARCRELEAVAVVPAAARKNSRTKFGADIVIELIKEDNPRRKDTRAHEVYGEMAKFVKKSGGKASLSDVMKETRYRRSDYEWDVDEARGNIRKA